MPTVAPKDERACIRMNKDYTMICDKNLDQHHPQHHASDPLKVQDLEEGASPQEILMRIYKHHCVYGEGKNSILCQEK